jgi:phospholipid transport system transporter-binding protein
VIRREGDSLILEGPVTLDTVPGLVGTAEEHLRQGVRVVDFRSVTDVDSAAVALALEWLRRAAESGRGLRLANLPAAMQNLAKLYGVSELLQSASS